MKISQNVQQHILEKLGDKIVESGEYQGDFWIKIEGKNVLSVVSFLKDDQLSFFDQFIDVCGVDYLKQKPRFESVIHLYSSKNKHRIRIRCLWTTKH
jgi:NADH-quinone oxidoreductase subunit C